MGPHLHCLCEPSQESSSSSEDDYQAATRRLGAPSLAELQHLGGELQFTFSEMEKRVRGALELEEVSTHTPLGQKDHLRQGVTPANGGFGSASTIDASKGERVKRAPTIYL